MKKLAFFFVLSIFGLRAALADWDHEPTSLRSAAVCESTSRSTAKSCGALRFIESLNDTQITHGIREPIPSLVVPNNLTTIPPLPAGEGRGEGESFGRSNSTESAESLNDSQSEALTNSFSETQLPYGSASDSALGLPADLSTTSRVISAEIPGKRIPAQVAFSALTSPDLTNFTVPLPEANTLAHLNYQNRRFGRLQIPNGNVSLFNPEVILVKFHSHKYADALRVEPLREWDAVNALRKRKDVQSAELDTFQQRQFVPDDPLLPNQWHHPLIGSYQAWNASLGSSNVKIAIVDTPFQMNHPDLSANTVSGWDVVANVPVNSSAGIVHSTMCAGMAAAVVNNEVGVAGAANCEVLPININGTISDMYNATIWAANNGVRVVNISWSGANSDILEAAGYYLKTNTAGILVMSAVDGAGFLNWTNQPDIYCISMTDAADNFEQTMYGPYIDFAAPGYEIYSTTTGNGYATGSGTSYAAPLFAGVVEWMFSVNPTLKPDQVINILTNTAVNPSGPGWNQFFGWGRINFGAAAAAVINTLPTISAIQVSNNQATISLNFSPNLSYTLWRTLQVTPPNWSIVSNAITQTNANVINMTDPSPTKTNAFYRVQVSLPVP
ncbi:MAG TPA: S8 family serine peptidase [Verrucomicrobiae bacterium]|jgi:subtilisin family serine protease|nr:S8 family serine peptidase [Verrucomicrobiae bacterium]